MADLVELTGLNSLLQEAGVSYVAGDNFEVIYEAIFADSSKADLRPSH